MTRRHLEDISSLSHSEVTRLFESGSTPDPGALVDWEYRGYNLASITRLLGFQKFRKGFYRHGEEVWGYNIAVQQSGSASWRCRSPHDAPDRFGFYRVRAVAGSDSVAKVSPSLLLDYGEGKNGLFESRLLRDYLRAVEPGEPDLLLGKAYLALFGAQLFQGFFILERDRRAPSPVTHRG